MTDNDRYEMLQDAFKKGANLAPVDFEFMERMAEKNNAEERCERSESA